jgi:hypothetical protein
VDLGFLDIKPPFGDRPAQLTSFFVCSTRFAMASLVPDSPLFPDARRAQAVARGICRLLARNDIWALTEMPLRNGRRADLMGIDPKGRIVIVEIKTARRICSATAMARLSRVLRPVLLGPAARTRPRVPRGAEFRPTAAG